MATINHTCDECGSKYSISYIKEDCETDPLNCPFCGEMTMLQDFNDVVKKFNTEEDDGYED